MRLNKIRNLEKYLTIKYFYENKNWSIKWMCRKLGVSTAAYYKWSHRIVSKQEEENIKLARLITDYDKTFRHILGYRRMTAWINHFNHTQYRKNRVHRMMKMLGIHSMIRRKRKKYISSTPEATAENILQRDFLATAPNEKWVTDVTEFKIPNTKKKIYLSVILDLYSRDPIAYVVNRRNNNELVFATYDKALEKYPDARPIFHSDRGFQYTNKIFQQKLQDNGMQQSMSRIGHCIDNGPVEGFWGIIKTEMFQMYDIVDEQSLRDAIDNYMKFYTEGRPQERFHCLTPAEVRQAAQNTDNPEQYPIAENKRIKKYKSHWCA